MTVCLLLLLAQTTADLLQQGRQAMAKSDSAGARAAFSKAVQLEPQSGKTQFMLGFFHYVENDFVQALLPLERAHKISPEDSRTALFLALTYEGLAQPDRAGKLFEETIRLESVRKSPNVETYTAFARFLFSNGRFDEAQTQVSKALKLAPQSREPHYEQARLLFERGEFTECIAEAKIALKLDGDGGVAPRQIHFLLSRAYSRTGDTAQASLHRRQFEAIPPRLVR